MFSLEGEYFTFLDDLLRTGLEDLGYAYESQSSNMDPVAQVEEIDKLIHGEIEDGFSAVDTGMCTIDNLSEFGY